MDARRRTIDGTTGDQRFFLGWAQVWRRNVREAAARQRLLTDPHSPSEYRTAVVRNLDGWYPAFKRAAGSGTLPGTRSAGPRLVRAAAALLALAGLSGCAGNALEAEAAAQPVFDPAAFFAGQTVGEGTLKVIGRERVTTYVEGMGRDAAGRRRPPAPADHGG